MRDIKSYFTYLTSLNFKQVVKNQYNKFIHEANNDEDKKAKINSFYAKNIYDLATYKENIKLYYIDNATLSNEEKQKKEVIEKELSEIRGGNSDFKQLFLNHVRIENSFLAVNGNNNENAKKAIDSFLEGENTPYEAVQTHFSGSNADNKKRKKEFLSNSISNVEEEFLVGNDLTWKKTVSEIYEAPREAQTLEETPDEVNFKKDYLEYNSSHKSEITWFSKGGTDIAYGSYKINIQIHADDLEKAAEILITKGLFNNVKKWGLTSQKCAIYGKGFLSIILYQGSEGLDQDGKTKPDPNEQAKVDLWSERLTLIDKVFFEARIRPRPLNLNSNKAIVNDKKILGSLYCYYKKDGDIAWDKNWQNPNHNYDQDKSGWVTDKGIVGQASVKGLDIEIKKKIAQIDKKLNDLSVDNEKQVEIQILQKTKEAFEFYHKISAMSDADAQKIQHNKKEDGLMPLEGELGLKDELLKANIATNEYYLRLKVKIKPANILDSDCAVVVNAGNSLLDKGFYGISGLSKAVHNNVDGKTKTESMICKHEGKDAYYTKKNSILAQALINQNQDLTTEWVTNVCIYSDKECKTPLLEEEQAKNKDGKLLWIKKEENKKDKKVTDENTGTPYHKQKTIQIKATKLRDGEVAVAELLDLKNVNTDSKLKDKTIFHAVGLDYRKQEIKHLTPEDRIRKLKEVYLKAFDKALEKGFNSIALPVLSVGVFELPEEEAAKAVCQAIEERQQFFKKIEICHINPSQKEKENRVLKLIEENLYNKKVPARVHEEVISSTDFSKQTPSLQKKNKLIEEFKEGFVNSMTPRRYQVALGILNRYCGVKKDEFDEELFATINNSQKFEEIVFDYNKESQDHGSQYGSSELELFNRKTLEFLDKNKDEMWKKLIQFSSEEAMYKDLLRIKEKFKITDQDKGFNKIKESYEVIFNEDSSDEDLSKSFNKIKKILIAARLLKNKDEHNLTHLTQEKALELSENYIENNINLDNIKKIEELKDLDENKITRIFTKFVALGEIDDLDKLKFRIKEKKVAQFHTRFADEIMHLNSFNQTKMLGTEVLFRGLDLRHANGPDIELTIDEQEEIIKKDFLGNHISTPEAAEEGKKQRIGAHQILKNRTDSPLSGVGNRISYAVATTFDPKIAIKYAFPKVKPDNEVIGSGWIYEIRPKKDKNGTIVEPYNSNSYFEVDFSLIEPEEIYAAYHLINKPTSDKKITLIIDREVINPNFQKRKKDEEERIMTKDFFSSKNNYDIMYEDRYESLRLIDREGNILESKINEIDKEVKKSFDSLREVSRSSRNETCNKNTNLDQNNLPNTNLKQPPEAPSAPNLENIGISEPTPLPKVLVATRAYPEHAENQLDVEESIKNYIIDNNENILDNNSLKKTSSYQSLVDFKDGIKSQENNPNPNSSYRGVGIKVVVEGEGLKIVNIFSPEIKRFKVLDQGGANFIENNTLPAKDNYITDVKWLNPENNTLEFKKVTELSLEEIARFFHQESKEVIFKTLDGKTFSCDNTINKSAIFSPNKEESLNKDDFVALSKMIEINPYLAKKNIDESMEISKRPPASFTIDGVSSLLSDRDLGR